MYIVPLKSALVEALQAHFSASFEDPDFQNLWVSIEYPRERVNYPGIWVNYEDNETVRRAGIDQREFVSDGTGTHQVTRWRFKGEVSFTCAALTSLERDRLFDEMVGVIAFANVEGPSGSIFRDHIDSNDFIAINGDFDEITVSGEAASQGTPWGTDEMIYERTASIELQGEFVSDPTNNSLAVLRDIQVMGYRANDLQPAFPDDPPSPTPVAPWDPTVWS